MEQVKILWDMPKYRRFKVAYNSAVAANQEHFNFDGHEFVTSYAKYLLEFLRETLT
jgi:hypothetical protein